MVYFLYGEDTYRSRKKLKQIEEKFKKTDKGRVNLIKIDGERTPWRNIEKEILASPFLHDKKLVIVENFLSKKGQKFDEALIFLKGNKIPSNTVVIFWEDSSPDERTALFKLLNQPKQTERFDFLPPANLDRWILDEVKNQGLKIERRAAALLAELIGPDLWQMDREISKLVAYSRGKKNQTGEISVQDVDLLVRGNYDEDIFALVDAIGNKNKKLAFRLLREQKEAGLKEDYIFAMLVRQFRILLQVKETVEKEFPFLSINDSIIRQKIAAILDLHPFVVSKALYQIKNYTLRDLKKIYGKLLTMDMRMKKSNHDAALLLDLFVAQIDISDKSLK